MTTPLELLDDLLALRAETTVTGRCPRCGASASPMPGVERQAFVHAFWCVAVDDNMQKLVKQTQAKLAHYPLASTIPGKEAVVYWLMGREGKFPLDAALLTARMNAPTPLLPTLNNARNAQQKLAGQSPVDAILKEARKPLDLLTECESLLRIAQSLLARAAQEGKYGPAVEAIGKASRLLELLGRLQGDLDAGGTTVNVQTNVLAVNPEWTALRGRILTALKPHPLALEGVLLALAEGGPPDAHPQADITKPHLKSTLSEPVSPVSLPTSADWHRGAPRVLPLPHLVLPVPPFRTLPCKGGTEVLPKEIKS